MRITRVAAAFCLLTLALPLAAQNADSTTWTRLVVNSKKLGEDRPVFVSTPPEYSWGVDRYPVLVLLDANDIDQFVVARANVRFLAGRNAIPPLIIVGIPNTKDRTHDLTPKATGQEAKDSPTAGGADAFADFIIGEVLPAIRSRYRTSAMTILAGHSYGGLFALHVAATRPGTFTGVIAMSPALQFNDSALVVTYSDALARSSAMVRLFTTSGGLEPPIDVTTKRFAARMESSKPSNVAFSYRFYPEDNHGMTPAPSLADGLRFIYAPLGVAAGIPGAVLEKGDSATIVKGLLDAETEYARVARSLSLPETFPELALNAFGYGVMQGAKLPRLAVWVFRRNIDRYPQSANVYDSLGDGLLAAGDSTGAKTQFAKAVEVGTRTGHPVTSASRAKLAALTQPVLAGKPKP